MFGFQICYNFYKKRKKQKKIFYHNCTRGSWTATPLGRVVELLPTGGAWRSQRRSLEDLNDGDWAVVVLWKLNGEGRELGCGGLKQCRTGGAVVWVEDLMGSPHQVTSVVIREELRINKMFWLDICLSANKGGTENEQNVLTRYMSFMYPVCHFFKTNSNSQSSSHVSLSWFSNFLKKSMTKRENHVSVWIYYKNLWF